MTETWFLIQANGRTYWRKFGDKDCWRNNDHSFTPKYPGDKILDCQESKFKDLDHKRTSLFLETGETGWLDRQGRWYPCPSCGHNVYAEFILKKKSCKLENSGWVMVRSASMFLCLKRLSADQRNWLLNQGYEVDDDE